jgi:hypothetical protein
MLRSTLRRHCPAVDWLMLSLVAWTSSPEDFNLEAAAESIEADQCPLGQSKGLDSQMTSNST